MCATAPNRLFLPTEGDLSPQLPARPPPDARLHRLGGTSMGTRWSVKAWAPAPVSGTHLQSAMEAELQHTVGLFSHWHAHSEVARFNAAPAGPWSFTAEAWPVVAQSLALAQATGGAVDPTLGTLVDLWGFGPPGPRRPPLPALPEARDIGAALRASGWQRLRVDAAERTLHKPAGLRLDLSGIAKGWAVDRLCTRLIREGAAVHLADVGGELKAHGIQRDLQPWWVTLEAPRPLAGDCAASAAGAPVRSLLALVDGAVATSGDWRRHFVHDGRIHAHTLDPRTGRPCANGVASVTVLHPQAMHADALATALTVMGVEQALAWCTQRKLAARIVERTAQGLAEHLSPTMAAMLAPPMRHPSVMP